MPLLEYRIVLLITYTSGEEVTRTVHQEGWDINEAIHLAEERAREEEGVEAVQCQMAW